MGTWHDTGRETWEAGVLGTWPEETASTTAPLLSLYPWMFCWFVEEEGLGFLPFPQSHQILYWTGSCGFAFRGAHHLWLEGLGQLSLRALHN